MDTFTTTLHRSRQKKTRSHRHLFLYLSWLEHRLHQPRHQLMMNPQFSLVCVRADLADAGRTPKRVRGQKSVHADEQPCLRTHQRMCYVGPGVRVITSMNVLRHLYLDM